jgi:hypothetical protein
MNMAVTKRFFGLNYGAISQTNAGQQPITVSSSTTGKDVEIAINFGDPVGSSAQIASNKVAKDRATVLAHVEALLNFMEHGGHGQNSTSGWFNT